MATGKCCAWGLPAKSTDEINLIGGLPQRAPIETSNELEQFENLRREFMEQNATPACERCRPGPISHRCDLRPLEMVVQCAASYSSASLGVQHVPREWKLGPDRGMDILKFAQLVSIGE